MAPDEVERTIHTYDRMAARYAARPVYPLERELDRFVALVGGEGWVVDVGCGPGQYARALMARGLRVIGLDLSAGMLAQAAAAGTKNLLRADMRRLPLPTGSIDGCFVCASLLHLPRAEVPATLTELHRVLRPGGVIYVALKEGTGEEWVDAGRAGLRFFVYYQVPEVDRMLAEAGFVLIDGWISPPGPGQRHRWISRFARS
ncbi:MAG TPA: class I SAM-dependent methyltransferase [Thermoflexia bacterium]|nr:class I SAM-dependent methyltransferase [Thermoflexia bacterium]